MNDLDYVCIESKITQTNQHHEKENCRLHFNLNCFVH